MAFEACLSSAERWWDGDRDGDGRGPGRRRGVPRSRRRGDPAREVHSHADATLDELSEGFGGRLPADLLCGLTEGLRVVDA